MYRKHCLNFHCNNGYENAPQVDVIHTSLIFFIWHFRKYNGWFSLHKETHSPTKGVPLGQYVVSYIKQLDMWITFQTADYSTKGGPKRKDSRFVAVDKTDLYSTTPLSDKMAKFL
jgi:hypothetical protein